MDTEIYYQNLIDKKPTTKEDMKEKKEEKKTLKDSVKLKKMKFTKSNTKSEV